MRKAIQVELAPCWSAARFGMVDAVLNRLLDLKVAKDWRGKAPNNPLLVLAILDLVEAGFGGAGGSGP